MIVGYISKKMKHATIWFCTGLPDSSGIPITIYEWGMSEHTKVTQGVPEDCPTPLGKMLPIPFLWMQICS